MKKYIILLFAIVSLSSCVSDDKQQTVVVKDRYSISIPASLTKVDNLNEDASLQYEHAENEFYIIVIDEPKSELKKALEDNDLTTLYSNDLVGYTNLLLDGFEQNVAISKKSVIKETKIDNMPAKLMTMSGKVEGIDVFYSLAFVQGAKNYYQIMVWTLASQESLYKRRMKEIMYTLKEL